MALLDQSLDAALKEFRRNRRLQFGVLIVVLIVGTSLGLDWLDALDAKEKKLQHVRDDLRALRHQSKDEAELRRRLEKLTAVQNDIDERLWGVSSEAVGQARLKDWLTGLASQSGGKVLNLVLSTPKVPQLRSEQDGKSGSPSAGEGVAREKKASDADSESALREFRANLTVPFTPQALEQLLAAIEGGKALATVESLNVNRRDRRVEIGVCVLMMIGKESDAAQVNADLSTTPTGSIAPESPVGQNRPDTRQSALPAVPPSAAPVAAPPATPVAIPKPATASVPAAVPSPQPPASPNPVPPGTAFGAPPSMGQAVAQPAAVGGAVPAPPLPAKGQP